MTRHYECGLRSARLAHKQAILNHRHTSSFFSTSFRSLFSLCEITGEAAFTTGSSDTGRDFTSAFFCGGALSEGDGGGRLTMSSMTFGERARRAADMSKKADDEGFLVRPSLLTRGRRFLIRINKTGGSLG